MIHLSTSPVSVSAAVIVARLCTPQRTAALSGGETVILRNNREKRSYQSLPNKEQLAHFACLLYPSYRLKRHPPSPFPWEDQAPLEIIGRCLPWKRPQPHVPQCISKTISRAHKATEDPGSDILAATELGWKLRWKIPLSLHNLSYKQILLIQYSILKEWPLVNPGEERSINKLSQGLLILWFPQTLNCHGERQGRARGWVLTPDLYPS